MLKTRICILMLVVGFPTIAPAQAYKCKSASGAITFQDQPCPDDAQASSVALQPVPNDKETVEARRALQDKLLAAQTNERKRSDAAARKQVDERVATVRAQRCDDARRQLNVVKEPGVIYRQDKEGNAVFLQDKDRATTVAAATKRVEAECR
jgi:hypothetical protein